MSNSIYKTISDINYIYSTPSLTGEITSIIKKGITLLINSINNGWASFKINEITHYIKESDLQLYSTAFGTAIIKYLDESTNEEIYPDSIKTSLPFGNHNFHYKDICGYTLNDDCIKSITLDDNSNNIIIPFKYKKDITKELLNISYIDYDTQKKLCEDISYTSNTLLDFSDTIIDFPEYDLISTDKTSSILTNLIYKYRKNTGSIQIVYMDLTNKITLSDADEYTNLKLGIYSFKAKNLSGFSVIGNDTQTVTLSYDNNKITITFNYQESYLPLDENIQNEIPYISTYYIKPIINLNEEVILEYYITDFYRKEYINNDFSELFTVKVNFDDNHTIVKTNLTAGNHFINLGSFSIEKEYQFSILCIDKYGRSSHELFNFFLVRTPPTINEYIMTKEDLISYNIKNTDDYEEIRLVNVDLNNQTMIEALTTIANNTPIDSEKYICFIGDSNNDGVRDSSWKETVVIYGENYNSSKVLSESTNTREGLQKLLDDKKSAGYTKIKLLTGTYRIDHLSPIYIPSNMTLDLNGSTIKQNQFIGNTSLMISLNNVFDAHVINGTIEGDYFSHDYKNSTNNSEWIKGISIDGKSKYSSYENLNIINITGYGACNGLAKIKNGTYKYTYLDPIPIGNSFKLGDIDRTTGLEISSSNRTTSKLIDITSYASIGYLSINRYLGYQGNPCNTWNIICHFYDENSNYIYSTSGYQYRNIFVPNNAKYMRVTILNNDYPNDLNVTLFAIPTHCSFKNLKLMNCRCVGMAQSAMKDMLVDSCEFINCGQSGAKCAFDAEDGWDQMQDSNYFNLNFHDNPNNDFLTCAGHNLKIENFINGKIYIWERTNSFCIRNSPNITNAVLRHSNRLTSGYSRFYNNTISSGISLIEESNKTSWHMAIIDSTILQRAESPSEKGIFINCIISDNKNIAKSNKNGLGKGVFIKCTLNNIDSSYNYGGSYTECILSNIKGNLLDIFKFNNCSISSFNCYCMGSSYNFSHCSLEKFSLNYNYWYKGATLIIDNCKINNTNYLLKLPNYSLKYPLTFSNNTFTSSGTTGMIYFYDDRTGGGAGELVEQSTLSLIANHISLSNSDYVITGLFKNSINNINIINQNNTFTPDNVLLCNPDARNSANINIIEN